jgi:transposase
MDERLPRGSLDASTLRMLLEQERSKRDELTQEVARLRAGLARQNERIVALERENAQLRQTVALQQQMIDGLQAQNAVLRAQVAQLQAENTRLAGTTRAPKRPPGDWPSDRTKQEREGRPRTKREQQHNRGWQRLEPDVELRYAADTCPQCGHELAGGWEHRRLQVIEVPPPAPVVVTDHVLIRRQCPACGTRVLPPVPAVAAGRVGQSHLGPRLLAQIATMAMVERLPIRQIQQRLLRTYHFALSLGGITGALAQVARRCAGTCAQLEADIRGSPVVHADETGWREDGIPGYIWTLSTARSCLFHRDASRAGAVIDALLTEDFGGILVTDFYAAYDHLPGRKQRCWAHLWRDIDALETEYPEDRALAAWVAGVRAIYDLARAGRPVPEQGTTPAAAHAREERARGYEQQLRALCTDTMPADRPEATLAKRIRRYLQELFTFVAVPGVPHTNNAAERSLRGLVIARKVSGGTRSAAGSTCRMRLASIAATARLRSLDPTHVFVQILTTPSHAF